MASKYKWLLFDLDNTLLDFSSASKSAFFETFADHQLHCDGELYAIYKEENAKVWTSFENKEIDTDTLRRIRFKAFFERLGISGIDPFAFNAAYLQSIIRHSEAYDGVGELLHLLSEDFSISIITNGLREVQRPRIEKVGYTGFFDSIVVSDEIGVAKPDIRFFEYAYGTIDHPPKKEEMLVIGDGLASDIKGGLDYGVDTCWISHGQENSTKYAPTISISSVLDLPGQL